MSEEIEKEIVEQLARSKNIIGELNEVVYDSDGEILSGRHRIKAGWEKEKVIDTEAMAKKFNLPRTFVKEMIKMHFNVQRRASREETQRRLLLMAEELLKMGVAKPNIASELAKWVPYDQKYILELLPQEYKQLDKVKAGKESAAVRLAEKKMEEMIPKMETKEATEEKPEAEEIVKSAIKHGITVKPYEDLLKEVEELRGRLEEVEYFLQSIAGEYSDICPFCHKKVYVKVNPDFDKKALKVNLVMFEIGKEK
jgi:hypothetical protein